MRRQDDPTIPPLWVRLATTFLHTLAEEMAQWIASLINDEIREVIKRWKGGAVDEASAPAEEGKHDA